VSTRIPQTLAGITLSDAGEILLRRLQTVWPHLEIHRTNQTALLSRELFMRYEGLIYVMPTGVVVRSIAPLIQSKLTDPAIVVLDVMGRWSISLLSGHEGGANRLAEQISEVIGSEPVVTTTSEAQRTLIAGIGCRRGTSSQEILAAIDKALDCIGGTRADIRILASIELKQNELGLRAAAQELGAGLRFLHFAQVKRLGDQHGHSPFVAQITGLPAVAEPCAVLAGSKTCLIMPKIVVGRVTVALAREHLSWSESVPEEKSTALTL